MTFARRPLMAGNWKMYKTQGEALEYARAFAPLVTGLDDRDILLCAPFTDLAALVGAAAGTNVKVGAQNMHYAPEGAFTGEVSAAMLLELGIDGAIVGHSERRQYFGETDETVALRAKAALEAGLKVIACVGELEAERESGETEAVLERQMAPIIKEIGAHERLVVAYEPVWAIGTGKTATPAQAQETHAFVRSLLDVPLLYGGSVKPGNAAELMGQPDVDGALVGGAALEVESFIGICEAARQTVAG